MLSVQFNMLSNVDWKYIQLYTTPTQISAWRWPCNWAETSSWIITYII